MVEKLPTGVDPKYEKFIIKKYQYWTLLLHEDQRYLGRAVLWLRRPGTMQDFFDIYPLELFELFRIGFRYRWALRKLWKPDLMNYAWLGNFIHEHGGHGHLHIIPRYKKAWVFPGIVFIDGKWGKNYAPFKKFRPREEVMFKIRDKLRDAIEGR